MESQLDSQLQALDNLDEDGIERMRQRRISQLKAAASRRQASAVCFATGPSPKTLLNTSGRLLLSRSRTKQPPQVLSCQRRACWCVHSVLGSLMYLLACAVVLLQCKQAAAKSAMWGCGARPNGKLCSALLAQSQAPGYTC